MWSISQHSVTAAQAIPHHLERKVLTRPVLVMQLYVLYVGKKRQKKNLLCVYKKSFLYSGCSAYMQKHARNNLTGLFYNLEEHTFIQCKVD